MEPVHQLTLGPQMSPLSLMADKGREYHLYRISSSPWGK